MTEIIANIWSAYDVTGAQKLIHLNLAKTLWDNSYYKLCFMYDETKALGIKYFA